MLPDYDYSSKLFSEYGLSLTEEQFKKLDIYAEFLVEYNNNVNLTAITEPKDVLIKHFLDSILPVRYCDIPNETSLIDVGTGAGFPSVPLKIYRNDIKLTLLDSLNKRIMFLQQLCDKIDIEAEFVHGRAEDFSKMPEYREKYDIACARAVANMSLLSELCIPFVKVGGYFISMKGPNEDIMEGENAIKILGGELTEICDYNVADEARRVVKVKKISQTPTKYPRNSSQLKKKPL